MSRTRAQLSWAWILGEPEASRRRCRGVGEGGFSWRGRLLGDVPCRLCSSWEGLGQVVVPSPPDTGRALRR